MKTATIENVNKMSKYGLKRRPTYEEIANLISENELITGKLPDRTATMFKGSPEGSFFDGADSMEQLKEEQGRLLLRQMSEVLLRQNARTAGRTFHTSRFQQLPSTSPVIAQPSRSMQVDDEGLSGFATPLSNAPPPRRMAQGTQLHAEIAKRLEELSQRRRETATNHAQAVARQTQPTLAEQLANVAPPRLITQYFPMDTDSDTTTQPKAKAQPRRNLFVDTSQSSNQAPVPVAMDTSSKPKRYEPETRVEPRGKVGRPRTFRPETTAHQIADRSGGDNPEQERPQRRENRNKEKQRLRLEEE